MRDKNWSALLDLSTPDTAWSSLYSEIIKEVDRTCPVKTFTVKSNKPEWITNNLIEQMRDRDYFYNKAKKTKDEDDWNIAKLLRNVTNSNIRRRAKADFIINQLESSKDNPKKFWRVIKRVFPAKDKNSKKAINLKNDAGDRINDKDIADYINDFLINIGKTISNNHGVNMANNSWSTHQNLNNSDIDDTDLDGDKQEIQGFTETDIFREIMKINIAKSSGLTEVNSMIIKDAFKVLTADLATIFNLSVKSTTFPSARKHATVIPIPKTGDLTKVENYRPISLLPLPGKILEKLIHEQINTNLENSRFFTEFQHGFRKNRSTTHAILQLTNKINSNMDNGTPTAAIFIDFRKAFDCVCHNTLIEKLTNTNTGPQTIKWVTDYLSNRHQCVLANNNKSNKGRIIQGVPLGPLFYIVYANDIPQSMSNKIALYEDDTVIYSTAKNRDAIKTRLQNDMDNLSQWCARNKLTINTNKTKIMIFGNTKKSRDKLENLDINFEGKALNQVTSYNYLGVKLDQRLNYDLHAKATIQKVADKIAYLRKVRRFVNKKAALSIYKNMILSIMEYGNILLASGSAVNKKKLQILQNRALKCALGLGPLTHTDAVHKLAQLYTLSARRKQHMLQLMFKQKDSPTLWKQKKNRRSGVTTRSAKKQLFTITRARTEKLKKSITCRAPRLWNCLPREIQHIKNLRLFNMEVKKYLKDGNKLE